jgi:hypothetical protein
MGLLGAATQFSEEAKQSTTTRIEACKVDLKNVKDINFEATEKQ